LWGPEGIKIRTKAAAAEKLRKISKNIPFVFALHPMATEVAPPSFSFSGKRLL
jgi:hypothetical protein